MHLMHLKQALSLRIFYLPAFWLGNRLLSLLEINLLNESFPRAESLPSAWQGLAKNLREGGELRGGRKPPWYTSTIELTIDSPHLNYMFTFDVIHVQTIWTICAIFLYPILRGFPLQWYSNYDGIIMMVSLLDSPMYRAFTHGGFTHGEYIPCFHGRFSSKKRSLMRHLDLLYPPYCHCDFTRMMVGV